MKNPRYFPMLGVVGAMMAGALLLGQEAPVAAPQTDAEDVQVLTRGPVHEAFAELISLEPEPGIIVTTAVPEAIEELPPEHQLEGDNVEWISGYWAWDEERNEFIWVSGIWRNIPPGRQWVPGYWSGIGAGKYQWTSGYWADAAVEEVTYVDTAPPQNIDVGPNVESPSANHSWVPGNWIWVERRYVWRPGYWLQFRPDWLWVPSRYCWTPRGYVYLDGYWDYSLARRGLLFAPVYFHRPIYTYPNYYYTPGIVVALNVFSHHLFARPRYGHYYFGDYYAPLYRRSGYYASFDWHSYRRGYDPIFAHQRWHHRRDRAWESDRRRDFEYFRDHAEARPAHTWAAMRDLRDDRFRDGRNRRFARSLDDIARNPERGQRFRTLDRDRRERFMARNRETRSFGAERRRIESRRDSDDRSRVAGGRERFNRSPIVGRQIERLATGDAPPERPVARRRGSDRTMRPDVGIAPERRVGRASSGRRTEAFRERNIPQRPQIRQSTQRRSETTRRDQVPQRPQIQPNTQRRSEASPQRRIERRPQIQRNTQSRSEASPQRRIERRPQIQRNTQRRSEASPQLRTERRPQIQRNTQRRSEASPQLRTERRPQIQRNTQRRSEAAPQRRIERRPQIQRNTQRRSEASPQRRTERRPEVRQSSQRRTQSAPQRAERSRARGEQSNDNRERRRDRR